MDWASAIDRALGLVKEYNSQDIRPTVRQIHYKLASEQVGGYENTEACYKSLSKRLVDVRRKGLISWDSISDHVRYRLWTRPKVGLVPNTEEIIQTAVEDLGEDPWKEMGKRVVIWLEKEALAEFVYDAIGGYYVPLAISRGYSSWTFIHENIDLVNDGVDLKVFSLGDHDPSGLDIERFTQRAMKYFNEKFEFKRIALTYEQVCKYNLLPHPTKKAVSRRGDYITKYGDRCWELNALEPEVLQHIIKEAVESEIKPDVWNKVIRKNKELQKNVREELTRKLKGWDGSSS